MYFLVASYLYGQHRFNPLTYLSANPMVDNKFIIQLIACIVYTNSFKENELSSSSRCVYGVTKSSKWLYNVSKQTFYFQESWTKVKKKKRQNLKKDKQTKSNLARHIQDTIKTRESVIHISLINAYWRGEREEKATSIHNCQCCNKYFNDILSIMVKWRAQGRGIQQKHVHTREDAGFHSGGGGTRNRDPSQLDQKWKIF